MGLVTLAWVFGSVFVTATGGATFTIFATRVGLSPFQFGLLAAAPYVASLASLPASLLIDRTGRRKPIFLAGLYLQRLMWVPIALVPVYLAGKGGPWAGIAPAVFLGLVLAMHLGGAAGGPAWVSWMADVVPGRLRGGYFSRRKMWGIAPAVPAAFAVGWLLTKYGPGHELALCGVIFLAAAVCGVADIALHQFVPAIPVPPKAREPFLRPLVAPLKDKRFLCFAGYIGTLTFAVGPVGQFVTLFLIQKLRIDSLAVQVMLLGAPMLAQLFVLPAWGKAVDRAGRKPVLAVASLGLVPVGLGWCLMGAGTVWLGYILTMAGAALWAGVEIANFDFVLEMSGSAGGSNKSGGGSGYNAVNGVIINLAGCAGGLCFGWIASALAGWAWTPPGALAWVGALGPFDVLFALSASLRLAAVACFLPFVTEPTAKPAAEAVRLMTANLYNNLFNAALQPARYLRLRAARPPGPPTADGLSCGHEPPRRPRPDRPRPRRHRPAPPLPDLEQRGEQRGPRPLPPCAAAALPRRRPGGGPLAASRAA